MFDVEAEAAEGLRYFGYVHRACGCARDAAVAAPARYGLEDLHASRARPPGAARRRWRARGECAGAHCAWTACACQQLADQGGDALGGS